MSMTYEPSDYVRGPDGKPQWRPRDRHRPRDYVRDEETGELKHRTMRRRVRPYDVSSFSKNALDEGFVRGIYRLPRRVRRFLRRPLEAYLGRPRMMQAVARLAWVIGKYHTGEHNFVTRGCGIGGDGAGFFLARKGLARSFPDLTEALVREAVTFLVGIGFIERITPKGDLVEVRCPRNSKSGLTYFRYGLKAVKDALGRIRSPLTMYRLGTATRQLFAKTLSPEETWNSAAVKEPLWMKSKDIFSSIAVTGVEGVHGGCADFDRAGHDPNDPRFDFHRPNPNRDPCSRPRFSDDQIAAAEATLAALRKNPPKLVLPPIAPGRRF